MATSITAYGYNKLLSQVKKALVEGQARVEAERVKTYWETGRIIHADILKHKGRAAYGAEVVKKLADDLGIGLRLLQYCIQFAKAYSRPPIVNSRSQFTWSHYRALISIPDDKERTQIERSASSNEWTSEELAARITAERRLSDIIDTAKEHPRRARAGSGRAERDQGASSERQATSNELLTPLRGTPYTYQITKRPNVAAPAEPALLVDLGFSNFYKVKESLLSKFSDKMIVESKASGEDYKFSATEKTAKDLYTYQAFVEKIIDADTLKVRLDLGFDVWAKQVLRLRGLDSPEAGTKEGAAAKAFVGSHIKEASRLIIRSSKSDKYDRYLADVFIPGAAEGEGEDIYLNNLLLENGHAQRWE